MKPLYSDACSGIIFNLAGEIKIGNEVLPKGVVMLPINKIAENIELGSGSVVAGVRFNPAIGFAALGRHYTKPTLLLPEQDNIFELYQIHSKLSLLTSDSERVDALYIWAEQNLNLIQLLPSKLEKALSFIKHGEVLGHLNEQVNISQRQIERLFKSWLEITPKHYQRILRIKKTICFLRQNKNANLAEVSQQFGFSDQAHMTREFRSIALKTPGQI